jgi:hypothetical protein
MVKYNTTQYNTTKYNTTKYNTTQYNTTDGHETEDWLTKWEAKPGTNLLCLLSTYI